eukprot:2626765-Pyramimonas_sp.AAC.1
MGRPCSHPAPGARSLRQGGAARGASPPMRAIRGTGSGSLFSDAVCFPPGIAAQGLYVPGHRQ